MIKIIKCIVYNIELYINNLITQYYYKKLNNIQNKKRLAYNANSYNSIDAIKYRNNECYYYNQETLIKSKIKELSINEWGIRTNIIWNRRKKRK